MCYLYGIYKWVNLDPWHKWYVWYVLFRQFYKIVNGLIVLFLASCAAGQYFNATTSSCENCAIGYYQQNAGQFYCNWCGIGQTTRDPASTSSSSCYGQ